MPIKILETLVEFNPETMRIETQIEIADIVVGCALLLHDEFGWRTDPETLIDEAIKALNLYATEAKGEAVKRFCQKLQAREET